MRSDDVTSLRIARLLVVVRPLTLLTELDDSETGFVSVLRRKGEEIFSHTLYKELILIHGLVFEFLLIVQTPSNSKCHSGSVVVLKVTYLQICNYTIYLNQYGCKCSRHSVWATGWTARGSNTGSNCKLPAHSSNACPSFSKVSYYILNCIPSG
jgi:hypothetical protein